MARLSSVERWSAMMIWSANLLVTDRNRSRIHASLRTGVTTTTRTGSGGDTVLRYDGPRRTEGARGVCDAGTGCAYWCDEPRGLPGGVRRRVAPGQWHARVPQRAGGAVSDARRRRRARGRRDRRDREFQGPIHRRARACGTALRIGERGRDRPAHLALHDRPRPRLRELLLRRVPGESAPGRRGGCRRLPSGVFPGRGARLERADPAPLDRRRSRVRSREAGPRAVSPVPRAGRNRRDARCAGNVAGTAACVRGRCAGVGRLWAGRLLQVHRLGAVPAGGRGERPTVPLAALAGGGGRPSPDPRCRGRAGDPPARPVAPPLLGGGGAPPRRPSRPVGPQGGGPVAAPEPPRYCGRRGTRGVPMPEQLVGTVVHYFKGPGVAVVRVTEGTLSVGDSLRFHGHTTEFTTPIVTMELNHQKVPQAKVGDEVAIQVSERTRQHDQVFKVTP